MRLSAPVWVSTPGIPKPVTLVARMVPARSSADPVESSTTASVPAPPSRLTSPAIPMSSLPAEANRTVSAPGPRSMAVLPAWVLVTARSSPPRPRVSTSASTPV